MNCPADLSFSEYYTRGSYCELLTLLQSIYRQSVDFGFLQLLFSFISRDYTTYHPDQVTDSMQVKVQQNLSSDLQRIKLGMRLPSQIQLPPP